MRRIFCFFVAIVVGVSPLHAADGTLEVVPKESEAPGAPDGGKFTLYSSSKALVIGINDYDNGQGPSGNWPKLSMAIPDAEEVAKALQAAGFTVTLLKNLKSDDLDHVFKDFFIKEGSDPNSRLLIWYAGHGHTINEEGYLVPADAPPPKQDIDFRGKALSLRRFGEYMREARSKHVLAIFDSCFAGTVFNVSRARPPAAITYATSYPVREYVSSGEADQEVSDDGTFRKLFVDALAGKEPDADPNKDGYITGSELGQFLFDKVTNLTSKVQTPRFGKLNALGYDRGDFVLQTKAVSVPPAAVASPAVQASEAAQAWGLIQNSDNVALLTAFSNQYGASNAFYAQLAAARIVEVRKQTEEAEQRQKKEAAERVAAALKAEAQQKEEADRKAREVAEARAQATAAVIDHTEQGVGNAPEQLGQARPRSQSKTLWSQCQSANTAQGRFDGCSGVIDSRAWGDAIKLADAYDERCRANRDLGLNERSILDCLRSIRLRPDYPFAYNNLGSTYLILGRYEEAANILDKSVSLKSNFFYSRLNRAKALLALGRIDAARVDLRMAIKLQKNNQEAAELLRRTESDRSHSE